jgi:hypothetical protein
VSNPAIKRHKSCFQTAQASNRSCSTLEGFTSLGCDAAPDDHLHQQVIRTSRQAHANTEVEFPFRAHVQIRHGENLLLLLLQRVKTRDRTERTVIFKSHVDSFRDVITHFYVGRKCDALRNRRPVK